MKGLICKKCKKEPIDKNKMCWLCFLNKKNKNYRIKKEEEKI